LVDIGTLAQSICLAALHHHLGSCIQQQGVFYPDVVKELAGIPQSKRVLLCVTLGYTDHDFPANQVQSTREPIERISTWIGFD
ncbi:MAG: nitroreductase family protein, partial [Chloroflexota bacterium]|nr:nitroreductase family protein [Chloroflexota bacterium]